MQLPNFKSMWKKAALAAVTLGGLLCFGGASSAQAHPVVVVRRPVPLGRLLKVPAADRRLDSTLSVLVGGFLLLHALLHLALATMLLLASMATGTALEKAPAPLATTLPRRVVPQLPR